MKYLFLAFCMALVGCATQTVCMNSNDSFKSVLDPSRSCSVRIREVTVGTDLDLPKSIFFKESDVAWEYRWIESTYKDGALELGHFVLTPQKKDLH